MGLCWLPGSCQIRDVWVAQLRPPLCNPSPPGSSVDGILQARTLEWVAISLAFSFLLHFAGRFFTHTSERLNLNSQLNTEMRQVWQISLRVNTERKRPWWDRDLKGLWKLRGTQNRKQLTKWIWCAVTSAGLEFAEFQTECLSFYIYLYEFIIFSVEG